jgi:hypothetical protein
MSFLRIPAAPSVEVMIDYMWTTRILQERYEVFFVATVIQD